jgi:predicted small lipoprotein YifL
MRRVAAGFVLLALASAGSGCGKKGPPVAPELRLPAPVADLAAAVDQDHVVLTWTNPGSRADGTRLRDLTQVAIHRREEPAGEPAKPAMLSGRGVVGYQEVARIALDSPAPATVSQGRVRWEDRGGLSPGRRYVYVAIASDSLGRSSPPSARAAVTVLAPPRPPGDVRATPGDGQVTLAWAPPTEFADGSPATGELRYQVLRGAGDGPLAPLTPEPIADTTFIATGLDNDTDYRFAVRALRVDPRATVLGPASAPVAAAPADTTAPSAPRDLVAVASPGAITLAWKPSPEPDVALYAVYRAAGPGESVRIGAAVGGSTTYTDRDVRPGVPYRYAVTALDRARRPNQSARSNEAAATAP